jgi:hypothetical protein
MLSVIQLVTHARCKCTNGLSLMWKGSSQLITHCYLEKKILRNIKRYQAKGRFQLNYELTIPFDGLGGMEVDLI